MKPGNSSVAPDGRHARIWLLINLCFAALALLIIASIGFNLGPEHDDSAQYRQAARNLIIAGDPYATTGAGDAEAPPYPNPPLLAYLLLPGVALDADSWRMVWFVLNATALVALYCLSLWIARPPGLRYYWGGLAAAVAVAPPNYLCLLYGQLGIVLALVLVAGFALAERRPALTGGFLALATLIKLYPGLMGIYYLLRGPRRVLLWAALFTVPLLAIPLLFHGLQPYRSYLERVLLSSFYPYAAEFNVSLTGFLRRLLTISGTRFTPLADQPLLANGLTLLVALLILGLCVRGSSSPGPLGALLGFSLWLCASLLLAPVNGYYNLGGLLLPMLVLVRALHRYRSVWLNAAMVLATVLLLLPSEWYRLYPALNAALLRGWGLLFLVPPLFGLLGYLALLAMLAERHRQAATLQAER